MKPRGYLYALLVFISMTAMWLTPSELSDLGEAWYYLHFFFWALVGISAGNKVNKYLKQ